MKDGEDPNEFADLAKNVSKKWRQLKPEKRAKFERLALQDKLRYRRVC